MNKSLLELLNNVTLLHFICATLLIAVLVGIISSQKNKIFKRLNKWRKTKNDEEDFKSLVYNLRDSVEEINNAIEQIEEDRTKNSESINNLTKIVIDMQKKNSKTKRAEIKEKIERIYSECHPAMTCTDMQFETLKDLIEEYEEHGGTNSFVHTTVEPEMHTWRKINRIKKVNNIYD